SDLICSSALTPASSVRTSATTFSRPASRKLPLHHLSMTQSSLLPSPVAVESNRSPRLKPTFRSPIAMSFLSPPQRGQRSRPSPLRCFQFRVFPHRISFGSPHRILGPFADQHLGKLNAIKTCLKDWPDLPSLPTGASCD